MKWKNKFFSCGVYFAANGIFESWSEVSGGQFQSELIILCNEKFILLHPTPWSLYNLLFDLSLIGLHLISESNSVLQQRQRKWYSTKFYLHMDMLGHSKITSALSLI